jgi:hypothetical protein
LNVLRDGLSGGTWSEGLWYAATSGVTETGGNVVFVSTHGPHSAR